MPRLRAHELLRPEPQPARYGTLPRDPGIRGLEHREALIYTLGKAAELEHLVMLQYLFAAFSLKQPSRRG